jgi:hypothetical protein
MLTIPRWTESFFERRLKSLRRYLIVWEHVWVQVQATYYRCRRKTIASKTSAHWKLFWRRGIGRAKTADLFYKEITSRRLHTTTYLDSSLTSWSWVTGQRVLLFRDNYPRSEPREIEWAPNMHYSKWSTNVRRRPLGESAAAVVPDCNKTPWSIFRVGRGLDSAHKYVERTSVNDRSTS